MNSMTRVVKPIMFVHDVYPLGCVLTVVQGQTGRCAGSISQSQAPASR